MKRELKLVLAVVIPVLLIALAGAAYLFLGRVRMNPQGTVGNTAGNLNNSGLFCEYNGKVYFANTFDGGSLFVMNPDETDLKRLNTLNVRNILAGGSYLYFFQTSSSGPGFGQLQGARAFSRCSLNGKGMTSLARDTVVTGQLVDNYLYLLTAPKSGPLFYKIKIDKSDKTVLAEYTINPACAENGIIYYNGTETDHYLYTLNTATDVSSQLWRGNIWYPVLQGDYVYYMDVAENYRLCRYSLSRDIVQVLTHDRVDCFNVGGDYIYYQKNGPDAQLICMRTDGSDARAIAQGNYTNINMTSQYVYFQAFGNDTAMYHSTLGSSYYETFAAAEQYQ